MVLLANLSELVDGAVELVTTGVSTAVSWVEDAWLDAVTFVEQITGSTVQEVEETVESAVQVIQESVKEPVIEAEKTVEEVKEDVVEAVKEEVAAVSDPFQDVVQDIKDAVEKITEQTAEVVRIAIDEPEPEPSKDWLEQVTEFIKLPDFGGIIRSIAGIPEQIGRFIFRPVTNWLTKDFAPLGTDIYEKLRKDYPEYIKSITVGGVATKPEMQDTLIRGIGILGLTATFRGPMWDLNTQLAYDSLPVAMPPAPDLIRMQVREVFDTKLRIEQLKPPPSPQWASFMRRLGFDEFWSDSYWAAHWELPSISQAYEMFHRLRPLKEPELAFSRKDLKELMTRQDVLPKYIDQLIEIAYAPYTRVDIRRMYKTGILETKEEVISAYQDIGYDLEHANNLAEFTVREYTEEEKMLTRSDILKAYTEDIISETELRGYLKDMQYSKANIDIIIDLYTKFKDKRDRELLVPYSALTITDLKKSLIKGNITEPEFVNALRARNYDDFSIRAVSLLVIEDIEKAARPFDKERDLSKSDILKAYRKDILSRETAKGQLEGIGYSEGETEVLLMIEDAKR